MMVSTEAELTCNTDANAVENLRENIDEILKGNCN